MIRVAIIDDQMLILKGLQKLLANTCNIAVVAVYTDAELLLDAFEKELPDVLVMDLQMPRKSGVELAGVIAKSFPSVKMIALTNVDVLIQMKEMLQTGCLGYLLKDVKPTVLIEAIETVQQGKQYIDDAFKIQLYKSIGLHVDKYLITRREKEILKLLAQKNSSQQIANKLYLSLKTVENHENNLLHKLKAKSTSGLVKLAINEGLL
jgi:DNA-binding NarL/FixJ family response regulator